MANCSFDEVSCANRSEIINHPQDQIANVHIVDEANLAAGTYYKMWDRRGKRHGSINMKCSGGVTVTLWATNDPEATTASEATWSDVTNTITGSSTLVDSGDMYFWDGNIVCRKMMIKYVTADASNAIDIWYYESP